jgi:hypothetical protein
MRIAIIDQFSYNSPLRLIDTLMKEEQHILQRVNPLHLGMLLFDANCPVVSFLQCTGLHHYISTRFSLDIPRYKISYQRNFDDLTLLVLNDHAMLDSPLSFWHNADVFAQTSYIIIRATQQAAA